MGKSPVYVCCNSMVLKIYMVPTTENYVTELERKKMEIATYINAK